MEGQEKFDTFERGEPYERYVGRWSRQVAPRFLDWLACPPGLRWLDVGCGTGALCQAILDRCAPAAVTGVEPSEGFQRAAQANLTGRAEVLAGSAAEIPMPAGMVDVAVSGLVLNFVPDPRAALREMARVVRPGGTVAAYVWDYAGKMEMMRLFWDAAAALDPAAADLDEGPRFPLCHQDALATLFSEVGMQGVENGAVEIETAFTSFDNYWQPFLGGQGPGPAYTMSLDENARTRLRERLRAAIPTRADGSISLWARAWAVKGMIPGEFHA